MISFRRKFEGKFREKFSSLALLYFFKKRINKSPDAIKGPAKQVTPPPQKLLPGYLINNGYLSYTCVWIFTYSNFPKALQKFF